jgi:hypothetical protein
MLDLCGLRRRQAEGGALVGRLSPLKMCAPQARRRQQVPSASLYRIPRYVGLGRVDIGEFDLRAGQALLGGGEQPPHRLRPTPFGDVTTNVQSVLIHDSEIELSLGIAAFGGLKQVFFHASGSSISGARLSAVVDEAPPPVVGRGDALSRCRRGWRLRSPCRPCHPCRHRAWPAHPSAACLRPSPRW